MLKGDEFLLKCVCKNKSINNHCTKCGKFEKYDPEEFRAELMECSFDLIFKCIEQYKEKYKILNQKITNEELDELEKGYKDFYDDYKNGKLSKEQETLFLDHIIFKHMKRILEYSNRELYTHIKENSDIIEGYTEERAKKLWNLILRMNERQYS